MVGFKRRIGWSLFLGGLSLSAWAGMQVEQPFGFGSVVVRSNDSVATLTLQSNGNVIADPAFIILTPPQRGRYRFYDLPPNTYVNITLVDNQPNATLSTASQNAVFTLTPQIAFSGGYTDAQGELEVTVYGTLKTSGDGKVYSDGTYAKSFQISVNY